MSITPEAHSIPNGNISIYDIDTDTFVANKSNDGLDAKFFWHGPLSFHHLHYFSTPRNIGFPLSIQLECYVTVVQTK